MIFFSRKIFKVIVVVFVFSWLVLWNPKNVFGGVRNTLIQITYPMGKVLINFADRISAFSEIVYSIDGLKNENEKLLKRNLELRVQNIEIKNIKKENDELRKQIELLPREKFKLLSAEIIGRNSYGKNDWFLINRGEKDGVKKNLPVIIYNGILVGIVEEVFADNAKVVLISNAGSAINGVVVETNAKGIIKGGYGLALTFAMVLQSDLLKIDDQVATSDISPDISAGLLIGKIKDISYSEDNLFQQAVIEPAVDYSDLRFVSVILQ